MGTKNAPAPNDCYHKAEPDEPLFTLLARDPEAPAVVRYWAMLRASREGFSEKIAEALRCADAMDEWRQNKELGIYEDS